MNVYFWFRVFLTRISGRAMLITDVAQAMGVSKQAL
jgi:hypothetical protein